MKPKILRVLCICSVLVLITTSCNLQQKAANAGDALGQNLVTGVNKQLPLLEQNLLNTLKAAGNSLDPDIQKVYDAIGKIGSLSDSQIKKLGTQLHNQIDRLKEDVQDPELCKYLVNLIQCVTGELKKDTKNLLTDIIQSTLDNLDAPTTKAKIDILVSYLLDENTKLRLQQTVSGALQPTIDTLTFRVDRMLSKNLPVVKKDAYEIIAAIGIVAAGVISFFWYERRKYSRLAKILTFQINEMGSKEEYDALTTQIQKQARNEELEPLLRKTLVSQGIN